MPTSDYAQDGNRLGLNRYGGYGSGIFSTPDDTDLFKDFDRRLQIAGRAKDDVEDKDCWVTKLKDKNRDNRQKGDGFLNLSI